MLTITRSELNKMATRIIDEETEMTELDLFEANHCDKFLEIAEKVKELDKKEKK